MSYENINQLIEMLRLFNSSNRMLTFNELNMLDRLIEEAKQEVAAVTRSNRLQEDAINKFYARRND